MQTNFLDFEQAVAELQAQIEALRKTDADKLVDLTTEIQQLEQKQHAMITEIFRSLNSWQVVQVARHPDRPHFRDYIQSILTDFDTLAGDRHLADDKAILGGIAYLEGQAVMVLGHQKGRTTKEKVTYNFGMPKPEGYRKALRLMQLAEQFNLPILSFVDTPGAYPGVDAEQRNQSEAIARNLQALAVLKTPIISIVIGEGGSGGALAIGIGDRTLMLQYAIYSVISPEGCASILWRDAAKAAEAAEVMGLTATQLLKLGLIDERIEEPLGGAHRDPAQMMKTLKTALIRHLQELRAVPISQLTKNRYERLIHIG
jgi:acetyl-CoA carboxylase carboxyl transferase subunit alpha